MTTVFEDGIWEGQFEEKANLAASLICVQLSFFFVYRCLTRVRTLGLSWFAQLRYRLNENQFEEVCFVYSTVQYKYRI